MQLQVINKALFERLKLCKVCSVFDSVPDNKKMPYVVLAETQVIPWNSKTTAGFEVVAGILIFSDYKGDKEINQIADAVANILSTSLGLCDGLLVIKQQLEEVKIDRFEGYREGFIKLNLKIHER